LLRDDNRECRATPMGDAKAKDLVAKPEAMWAMCEENAEIALRVRDMPRRAI
jgi:hypothetical protein